MQQQNSTLAEGNHPVYSHGYSCHIKFELVLPRFSPSSVTPLLLRLCLNNKSPFIKLLRAKKSIIHVEMRRFIAAKLFRSIKYGTLFREVSKWDQYKEYAVQNCN